MFEHQLKCDLISLIYQIDTIQLYILLLIVLTILIKIIVKTVKHLSKKLPLFIQDTFSLQIFRHTAFMSI